MTPQEYIDTKLSIKEQSVPMLVTSDFIHELMEGYVTERLALLYREMNKENK